LFFFFDTKNKSPRREAKVLILRTLALELPLAFSLRPFSLFLLLPLDHLRRVFLLNYFYHIKTIAGASHLRWVLGANVKVIKARVKQKTREQKQRKS
jgi:hypothetical protein